MNTSNVYKKLLISAALITFLSACADMGERLSRVGKNPELAEIENPKERMTQKERQLQWPLPTENASAPAKPNSLWQTGSKTFFRDARAARVGDVLRVQVVIDDRAELDNSTTSSRNNQESFGMPTLLGFEDKIQDILPGEQNLDELASVNGNRSIQGSGTIGRKERIQTEIAAIVVDVLPNGNLIISGKQEVRVNGEVREVSLAGVIRPEDIASNNTIGSNQIAEARISYGGRGTLSDAQRPRYGSEILDIIAPF